MNDGEEVEGCGREGDWSRLASEVSDVGISLQTVTQLRHLHCVSPSLSALTPGPLMPFFPTVSVSTDGLLHSTSSIGLPRLVPEGGLDILGRHYAEGTVLSVPSYTIHREAKTWGDDYEAYRPERWFEIDQAKIQKCFNPFSYGPR